MDTNDGMETEMSPRKTNDTLTQVQTVVVLRCQSDAGVNVERSPSQKGNLQ